jgi:hypothetical protein
VRASDFSPVQKRYMQTEAMAKLTPKTIDAVPTETATIAA